MNTKELDQKDSRSEDRQKDDRTIHAVRPMKSFLYDTPTWFGDVATSGTDEIA